MSVTVADWSAYTKEVSSGWVAGISELYSRLSIETGNLERQYQTGCATSSRPGCRSRRKSISARAPCWNTFCRRYAGRFTTRLGSGSAGRLPNAPQTYQPGSTKRSSRRSWRRSSPTCKARTSAMKVHKRWPSLVR